MSFRKIIEKMDMNAEEMKKDCEWVWVEGFKGTDKDMCCLDFQYELGVQHDMPEGEEIEECRSGFHLCLNLEDVFRFYDLRDGNRFFAVKALVRESDVDKYYHSTQKLVAKSIVLTREIQFEELLPIMYQNRKYWILEGMPDECYKQAMLTGPHKVFIEYYKEKLIEFGYSQAFVEYLLNTNGDVGLIKKAVALGSLDNLSMDVKVLSLFFGGENCGR